MNYIIAMFAARRIIRGYRHFSDSVKKELPPSYINDKTEMIQYCHPKPCCVFITFEDKNISIHYKTGEHTKHKKIYKRYICDCKNKSDENK